MLDVVVAQDLKDIQAVREEAPHALDPRPDFRERVQEGHARDLFERDDRSLTVIFLVDQAGEEGTL